MFCARLGETGGQPRSSIGRQDNRLDHRGLDPPSGEQHSENSPATVLVQAFIQPAVLVFPITRAGVNRLSRIETFER